MYLLDLNEIRLYLKEKNNIINDSEKRLNKLLNENKINKHELKTIMFITKFFEEGKYWSNEFVDLIDWKYENINIYLNMFFTENNINDLKISINNDDYLNKWYKI